MLGRRLRDSVNQLNCEVHSHCVQVSQERTEDLWAGWIPAAVDPGRQGAHQDHKSREDCPFDLRSFH